MIFLNIITHLHQNISFDEINNGGFFTSMSDDISFTKATIRIAITSSDEYCKELYFLASKSQGSIYILFEDNDRYNILNWTSYLESGSKNANWHSVKTFDTYCVIGKQLLVLGNVDDENWNIYTFPYYKTSS